MKESRANRGTGGGSRAADTMGGSVLMGVRIHPDHLAAGGYRPRRDGFTFEGAFAAPAPPAADMLPPPVPVMQWVSQETAARRLNVRLSRVAELVAAGLLVGEWGPNSTHATAKGKRQPHCWWIGQASLLALLDAQPTGVLTAVGNKDHRPTRATEASREDRAELYGLLTLADVRELARRRKRFDERRARVPLPVYDPTKGEVTQCPD